MKLTKKEKDILSLALKQLDAYYDKEESDCRKFKWLCGEEYVKNRNVFEIETKTINDILNAKKEGRRVIMNLINKL